MKTLCGAAVIAATIVGCGTSIETTSLSSAPRPLYQRDPATVELYSSGAPTRPHVDFALLRADQVNGGSSADTGEMVTQLRAQAAKMGCDAIVLGAATKRAGIPPSSSLYFLDPGAHGMSATCLVYEPAKQLALAPAQPGSQQASIRLVPAVPPAPLVSATPPAPPAPAIVVQTTPGQR